MSIDLRSISSQFQDLDWKDIGTWSSVPKIFMLVLIFCIICGASYFLVLTDKLDELNAVKDKELVLKRDYSDRLTKAVNLEALKKQKEDVTRYVADLEKQLPDKAEMDKLLSDINYAGISKGLQFELFRPGANVIENYYSELPITIKLTGTYHKLAGFSSDLAALSRIVTLNNINLTAPSNNSGLLTMEAVAKTFRYLDKDEIDKVAKLKSKEGATK